MNTCTLEAELGYCGSDSKPTAIYHVQSVKRNGMQNCMGRVVAKAQIVGCTWGMQALLNVIHRLQLHSCLQAAIMHLPLTIRSILCLFYPILGIYSVASLTAGPSSPIIT